MKTKITTTRIIANIALWAALVILAAIADRTIAVLLKPGRVCFGLWLWLTLSGAAIMFIELGNAKREGEL